MRITKKLKARLHNALCMDDVLYETHRRLSGEIQRQANFYIRRRKTINQVVGRAKDGTYRKLQIITVDVLNSGTHILVELP